jgi:hypothetical protein
MEPTLKDRTPAALAHRAGCRLGRPERRPQDRPERLLEVLLGLLEERHGAEDAGAVDEDVDAAEALDGGRDEVLGLLAPRDLARPDRHALAGGVELGHRRLEDVRARAAEDDRGALLQEPPRRGLADTATTAGDDDDLAVELRAHSKPSPSSITCSCIRCMCIIITCTCIYCKCSYAAAP